MKLAVAFMVSALLVLGTVVPAAAQEMDGCAHDATIASLRDCVEHAIDMGHITDGAIAQSLLVKLDRAQAALDGGDTQAAIGLLTAFVRQVSAQADKTIVAEHAEHLIMHATHVIDALRA